jgi:hypothetical protein
MLIKILNFHRLEYSDKLLLLLYFFNSTVSLKIQILFFLNHLWSKIISMPQRLIMYYRSNKIAIKKYKNDRFCILGLNNINVLKARLDSLFKQKAPANVITLECLHDEQIATEIFRVIEQNYATIFSIFGSHFQTYWIMCYRTFPGDYERGTSFCWHQDADPKSLLKLFIYLDDTTQENGALKVFDYKNSREILINGFRSHSEQTREDSQSMVMPYAGKATCIEGSSGLLFMFDNNLVHRGTPPESGYRTVLSIEIYPSAKRLTFSNVRNSLALPISDDFPTNPFCNKYRRINNSYC